MRGTYFETYILFFKVVCFVRRYKRRSPSELSHSSSNPNVQGIAFFLFSAFVICVLVGLGLADFLLILFESNGCCQDFSVSIFRALGFTTFVFSAIGLAKLQEHKSNLFPIHFIF